MAKIKREELSGKFLEAFDKIVDLKNSDDAKQREAGLKGEKTLEKLLSSKKGEAVKKEVKPKATPKAKAKAKSTPKSKAKPKAKAKAKPKAKPKSKTKTSTTPKVLPFSTRASNLMKKEGLSWADAKAKLSKEIKDEKDKIEAKLKADKKQALNELEKLTKAPEFQKALSQYPKKGGGKKRAIKTTLSNDGKRQALPRGKRVSKNGKTYYEYRDNRSDVNSLPAPKGQYRYKGKTPPFLADGGAIDSLKRDMNSKLDIHSEYYAKGGEIDVRDEGNMAKTYDGRIGKISKVDGLYYTLKFKDGKLPSKLTLHQKDIIFSDSKFYAKGGRTISIVNDGVQFDKSKYKAVYGDFDNDGTVNIDDANPLDKTKSGQVEQVELRKTFDKLLGVKAELDEIMYDAVETLDEKAPEGADIYARTKTPYSILKKLVEKRMLDPKRGLTDMIGTTIAVDNQKELEQVRDKIDGGLLGKVLDRDDFYKTPNAGYRAYHYIVEYKGVPVEVQLKTKNMKKLHEVSHEAYKNGTLNAKSLDSLSKTFMRADKGDTKAKSEISRLLKDKKLLASKISKGSMAKGGKIGFDGLAKKVAKSYEGTRVPKQFQEQYGKTYNKKEAMEVGKKVAGKVYRQQQSMEKGGELSMEGYWDMMIKTNLDRIKRIDKIRNQPIKKLKEDKLNKNKSTKEIVDNLNELKKLRAVYKADNNKLISNFGGVKKYSEYLRKEKNENTLPFAKGGEVIEYSKVYEILKDKIDDAVEDIESTYGNAFETKGEEVESKSRDGFIPYTNGGYGSRWFEYGFYLFSEGTNLPTKTLDEKIEEFRETNREYALERFEKEYPEIVKELGGIDNVDYSSLMDAGYDSEADDLDEFERDDEDSIMMEVEAFYYNPNNDRGEDGKHTIQLSGAVNLEAPYHRSGNLEDYIEERFTFDSYKELEDKLDKGLAKVVSWFEGDMYDKNPRELKIRRMEAGGTLPTPFGQAGLVGETGTMNEMDLFAMGGGLPQGVHQYYGQTYNPAYPTPHGYAKGGKIRKSPFKVGDMVYSYQNPNDKMRVSFVEDRGIEDGVDYGWGYKVALKTDEDGKYDPKGKYSQSSNWMSQNSVSKTKKTKYAKGGDLDSRYSYDIEYVDSEGDEYNEGFDSLEDAKKEIKYLKENGYRITRKFRYLDDKYVGSFAKGGMMQGYNDRLDESLGNRDGVEPMMMQSYKDRRDESKGMEKAMGRRAYQSVGTMDRMAKGGEITKTGYKGSKQWQMKVTAEDGTSATIYAPNKSDLILHRKELIEFENWKKQGEPKMAKGGKIGFDGLAKKVAKKYEGKPVKEKFQSEYGKTYSKAEAMEVGKKVAGKVYRQQQSMAKGGEIKMSEVYNVNGKDYLFSTPIQNAKGTYTGWDAYEVVYDTFDGEKHLNYTKTKKGKSKYFPNGVKRTEAEDYFAKGG